MDTSTEKTKPCKLWVNLKRPISQISAKNTEVETSYKSFTSEKTGFQEYISLEEHQRIIDKLLANNQHD